MTELPEGLNAQLDELATRIESATAEVLRQTAERERADHWRATYNAALTGLYAAETSDSALGPRRCHEYATQAADRAHGTLEQHEARVDANSEYNDEEEAAEEPWRK